MTVGIITATLSIEALATKARDLAYLRITESSDREILASVAARIQNIKDDRNLAVHGVRSLMPDETVRARIARGKYRNAPEVLSLLRLRSIVVEVARIIAELEPMLARYRIIEDVTAISTRYNQQT